MTSTAYRNAAALFMAIAAALACLVPSEAKAGTPVRIDTMKCHVVLPRPALSPVPSLVTSPSDPIDTLDTVNEHVKVVLYGDNTWQYYKTPEFQGATGVFDEYWSGYTTNPYNAELSSLPESWSVWLVDSLGQYHCPYMGNIHYRASSGYAAEDVIRESIFR